MAEAEMSAPGAAAEFPGLPPQLVEEALAEWYYPRVAEDGPLPERFVRVMRVVEAFSTSSRDASRELTEEVDRG